MTSTDQSQTEYTTKDENILVIDDDPYILEALKLTLVREGYVVLTASNAIAALELLREHSIALVICDQKLPGMSGSILLHEAEKIAPDAVRIALTGNSDLNIALEAINVGHVSHFLLKPWDTTSLIQVVVSGLEKFRLVQENRRLHQTILLQHNELEKTHAQLRYELQLGARIHEELLLGKLPERSNNIDVAASTIPSKEIDGDFFDFYSPNSDLFDIAVGDVMGKGIPAALVGIAVKIELQRFAMPFTKSVFCEHGQPWVQDILTPAQIVGYTDEAITQHLMRLNFFVTLLYGRFDFNKHTFTYVDCGTPKPIHYCRVTGQCNLLNGQDIPIGVANGYRFSQIEVDWHPGDIFVIYSDGVTESRAPNGELFGIERLTQIISESSEDDSHTLLSKIKKAVMAFSRKESFDDDVTLVVARMLDFQAESCGEMVMEESFSSDINQLQLARDFIARLCHDAPGDAKKFTADLQLAINEAFCNIVEHSYQGRKDGEIVIRGTRKKDGLLIDLCDQGVIFDPLTVPRPEPMAAKDCGYGLFIMGQITDKLTYLPKRKNAGWNRLRIYKSYASMAIL